MKTFKNSFYFIVYFKDFQRHSQKSKEYSGKNALNNQSTFVNFVDENLVTLQTKIGTNKHKYVPGASFRSLFKNEVPSTKLVQKCGPKKGLWPREKFYPTAYH